MKRNNMKLGAMLLCALMIAVVFASIPISAEAPMAESRAGNERAVLVEMFTATNCGYCPGADGAADRMVSNYGPWAAGYWPNRTSLVQWHLRGDPYQNSDGQARASFLGASGTPAVFFDGVSKAVGGSQSANNTAIDDWYKGHIDSRPADTVVKVSITYVLDSDWEGGTYNVTFEGVASHSNTSLEAKVAFVEDINVSHGAAQFRFTGRKMLYDQSISINDAETKYASGQFTVSNQWNKYKMGFVAWVESHDSKEVLGSGTKLFPKNDPPVVNPGSYDVSFDEDNVDTTLDLDDIFTDPQGSPMDYNLQSQAVTSYIMSSVDGQNVVTFTPDANWFGEENFLVTADDGDKTAQTTILVTVNSVNDVPTVDHPIADFSMNEGATDKHIDLDNVFGDVETTDLTFEVTGMDQLLATINSNTNIVTIEAPVAYGGVETLTFKATDEQSLFATDEVTITIKDVNYAPVIVTPMQDITMDEDTTDNSIDLDDVFYDQDGDTLQMTPSNNVYIVVTIDANNVVNFTPNPDWNGQETIVFEASDNIAAAISDSLTVTVLPVNDAPTRIGDLEDIEIEEDGLFETDTELGEIFFDVDGNVLSYDLPDPPENIDVTIEDDTTVTFVPIPDFNGEEIVTIVCSDGLAETEYEVTVTVTPLNDGPVLDTFSPDSDVVIKEGETQDFSVSASDIDGDEIYYEWYADGQKAGETGTSFTYTTDSTSSGVHKVRVSITDGLLEVTKEWRVTVHNVNNAPSVEITSPTGTEKVKAGKVTLAANITDEDGDTLTITWSVDGKPIPSSNADSIVAKLKGGKHVIKVTVSDGTTASSDEVTVQVKGEETGSAPGFEIVFLLGALFVVFLLRRRK